MSEIWSKDLSTIINGTFDELCCSWQTYQSKNLFEELLEVDLQKDESMMQDIQYKEIQVLEESTNDSENHQKNQVKLEAIQQQSTQPRKTRIRKKKALQKMHCSCSKIKCDRNYCQCYKNNRQCLKSCKCYGCGNRKKGIKMKVNIEDFWRVSYMFTKP